MCPLGQPSAQASHIFGPLRTQFVCFFFILFASHTLLRGGIYTHEMDPPVDAQHKGRSKATFTRKGTAVVQI